jgi:hypothetical protein
MHLGPCAISSPNTACSAAGASIRPCITTRQLDDCTVMYLTLLPPFSPQVLFEAPGRAPILHSGDCRWQPGGAVATHPALLAARGRCQLVLDTTYCAPQHAFPPQVRH